MEGIERVMDISHDSGVAVILLISFALIVFGYVLGGPTLSFKWSHLFSLKDRPSIFAKTVRFNNRVNLIFNFQFILTLGVFVTALVRRITDMPFEEEYASSFALLLSAIFALYYTLWLNTVRWIGSLFLPKSDVKMWVRDHFTLSGEIGILLYGITVIAIYFPPIGSAGLYFGIFSLIMLKGIAIYKGIRLFFGNLYAWFYLILYLCALEMIPIVLLYKSIIYIIA